MYIEAAERQTRQQIQASSQNNTLPAPRFTCVQVNTRCWSCYFQTNFRTKGFKNHGKFRQIPISGQLATVKQCERKYMDC